VKDEPYPASAAHVFSTRRGRGGNPATPNDNVKYVIDFEGGDLGSRVETDPDNAAFADITVSRGKLIEPFAIRVKGTDRWRIIFDLDVQGADPVDMRAFLKTRDGQALTETWLFQHFPEQKNF
jgi:glucans biosynthesis protein